MMPNTMTTPWLIRWQYESSDLGTTNDQGHENETDVLLMRPIVRPTMHLSISLSPPSAYAVRDPASGIWHLPSDPTAPTRLSRVTHETRILSFLLPLYFFFKRQRSGPFFCLLKLVVLALPHAPSGSGTKDFQFQQLSYSSLFVL